MRSVDEKVAEQRFFGKKISEPGNRRVGFTQVEIN